MHIKSKEEQNTVVASIMENAIKTAVEQNANKGKQYCCKIYFIIHVILFILTQAILLLIFLDDVYTILYDHTGTTSVKISFILCTCIVSANSKRNKK